MGDIADEDAENYGVRTNLYRYVKKAGYTMVSAVDTEKVMARIRRLGVPDDIQSLIMSLPVHVLAQSLMVEDQTDKRFPAEPPEHSVLMWEQVYPNSALTYHYAALRAGDQWWITGRADRNPSPISWA